MKTFFLLLTFITSALPSLLSAEKNTQDQILSDWMTQQKKYRQLAIEFTQTRTLPTLKRPQTHQGKLWFKTPDQFRWQLGDPPELIVLKQAQLLHAIFPAKQKAEKIDLSAQSSTPQGPASEYALMLRYPIADNLADFYLQFEVLNLTADPKTLQLALRPRALQARKWVKQISFQIERTHGVIERLELELKNGSRLVTQVTSASLDAKIDPQLFQYDLSAFTISER